MSITNRLFQIEPLGWTGRGLKIVHLIIKVIMHTGTATGKFKYNYCPVNYDRST